jgi:hypothetical protein
VVEVIGFEPTAPSLRTKLRGFRGTPSDLGRCTETRSDLRRCIIQRRLTSSELYHRREHPAPKLLPSGVADGAGGPPTKVDVIPRGNSVESMSGSPVGATTAGAGVGMSAA